MADTTRTFIALEIPTERREKLGRLQGLIAPDIPGARWVELDLMHVTLAFLGEIPHVDLGRICRVIQDAASRHAPFELKLEGLGVFPDPAKSRVVWVGLTGPGLEPLEALQNDLAAATREVGYPPADERFHPHVTLGRIKVGKAAPPVADVTPLLRHYAKWAAGMLRPTEVVVYGSTVSEEGPAYTPLTRAKLGG